MPVLLLPLPSGRHPGSGQAHNADGTRPADVVSQLEDGLTAALDLE